MTLGKVFAWSTKILDAAVIQCPVIPLATGIRWTSYEELGSSTGMALALQDIPAVRHVVE